MGTRVPGMGRTNVRTDLSSIPVAEFSLSLIVFEEGAEETGRAAQVPAD